MCYASAEVLGDIEGVLSGDLNTYGFFSASGFDAVDEAHRSTAARCVILRCLAGKSEGRKTFRESDIEDMSIRPVMDSTPSRQPRPATRCLSCAGVGHAAKRLNEKPHIVAEATRHSCVFDAACSPALSDRTAVGIEEPLKDREPHLGRVKKILFGNELILRFPTRQPELAHRAGDGVLKSNNLAGTPNAVQDIVDFGFAACR